MLSANEFDYVKEWLDSLGDIATRARIEHRIERRERGLFGDIRSVAKA